MYNITLPRLSNANDPKMRVTYIESLVKNYWYILRHNCTTKSNAIDIVLVTINVSMQKA